MSDAWHQEAGWLILHPTFALGHHNLVDHGLVGRIEGVSQHELHPHRPWRTLSQREAGAQAEALTVVQRRDERPHHLFGDESTAAGIAAFEAGIVGPLA